MAPPYCFSRSFWEHPTPGAIGQSDWKSQESLVGNDLPEGSIHVNQGRRWTDTTDKPGTPCSVTHRSVA